MNDILDRIKNFFKSLTTQGWMKLAGGLALLIGGGALTIAALPSGDDDIIQLDEDQVEVTDTESAESSE